MTAIRRILAEARLDNAAQEATWIVSEARDQDEAVAWATRRARGEPLQYILGTAPFRRLDLRVGPGAFIPRPETELVAQRALELLPEEGTIVDLCTGSGAIALAAAAERPDATVHATEISEDALAWALRNAGHKRVRFYQGDLFDPLPLDLVGAVDVVVANPPYISYEEVDRLPPDLIDHEPHVALLAEGSGLSVLQRIVTQAPRWLRPGGWLVLEIGETQGAEALELLTSSGYLDATVASDLAGRDRIACGRRP